MHEHHLDLLTVGPRNDRTRPSSRPPHARTELSHSDQEKGSRVMRESVLAAAASPTLYLRRRSFTLAPPGGGSSDVATAKSGSADAAPSVGGGRGDDATEFSESEKQVLRSMMLEIECSLPPHIVVAFRQFADLLEGLQSARGERSRPGNEDAGMLSVTVVSAHGLTPGGEPLQCRLSIGSSVHDVAVRKRCLATRMTHFVRSTAPTDDADGGASVAGGDADAQRHRRPSSGGVSSTGDKASSHGHHRSRWGSFRRPSQTSSPAKADEDAAPLQRDGEAEWLETFHFALRGTRPDDEKCD